MMCSTTLFYNMTRMCEVRRPTAEFGESIVVAEGVSETNSVSLAFVEVQNSEWEAGKSWKWLPSPLLHSDPAPLLARRPAGETSQGGWKVDWVSRLKFE
jgi:hypothetical protein